MKVEIVNRSRHPLPDYSTPLSAGMDIRANLEHPVTIGSGKRMMIPTGLYISLPASYEAQIRPRSGLALKYGISVLNSPGTIDADYRGEIGIILINHGQEDFEIRDGDRICQMIISRHEKVEWMETKELEQTDRGIGGFGHTGQ